MVEQLARQGDYLAKAIVKISGNNDKLLTSIYKSSQNDVSVVTEIAQALDVIGSDLKDAETSVGYDISAILEYSKRRLAYDQLVSEYTAKTADNTGKTYDSLTHKGTVYMSMIDADEAVLNSLAKKVSRSSEIGNTNYPLLHTSLAATQPSSIVDSRTTVHLSFPNMVTGDREALREFAQIIGPEIEDAKRKGQLRAVTTGVRYR